MNARLETSPLRPARLRAQRRSVAVNGRDVLPWSMTFTFGLSAEALAVRAELAQVVQERRALLAEGPSQAAAARTLLARVKAIRDRLGKLAA